MQYTVFIPFFIFYDRIFAFVNNKLHKDVDFTVYLVSAIPLTLSKFCVANINS